MGTKSNKPNVLMILIDDLGSYQLSCYGSKYYETPRLDVLAAEGVRCSRAYATSPVCSPARAAIYTGRHPARLHVTNYIPGSEPKNPPLLTPDWRKGLPVSEVSLGEAFKRGGYETVHYGKWHLAEDYNYAPHRPMDPESHGFDRVKVTHKPKTDFDPEKDPHNIEKLTNWMIDFLKEPHEKPFLAVLAHNAIHRPEMAPRSLVQRFEAKPCGDGELHDSVHAAMVSQLDSACGRLLDTLESEGMMDDTIVLFTSDHGAFCDSQHRKPWRGAKADLYEGGLRVPLFMRWPAGFEGRRTLSGAVSTADIFPTLLELAGVKYPDAELDGVSLSPWLEGTRSGSSHDVLYWHFPHYHHLGLAPCGSIVRGRHKLVEWYDASIAGYGDNPAYELFDLQDDPWEERDISVKYPDLKDELAQLLRQWRKGIGAQEMKLNPYFDPERSGQRSEPPEVDASDY